MDPKQQAPAIIPKPAAMRMHAGVYPLQPGSLISYPPEGLPAARLLERLTGFSANLEGGAVRLVLDPATAGDEAYRLDIDGEGVRISASAPAGLFYGAQTLRQLLPPGVEKEGVTQVVPLPYLKIVDQPRFAYRGFMLDVSRHFFSPEELERVLDLLALLKINRFHWHLTNDQGWRIEIQKYPRLTEVGSQRSKTQVGGWLLAKPRYDDRPYGGSYTQEEIRRIVGYAQERHIEVIPEISSPGHAAAAIAAYPHLACSGEPSEVRAAYTSFSQPMCVGKESTFTFLADVFAEVASLFPSGTVHIGGDEVKKSAWKKCPHCRDRMAAEGLQNVHELQAYFENRLVGILKPMGLHITAWSDAIRENMDPGVTNQYWFFPNRKRAVEELKKGRKTIVSEFTALYMDYSFKVIELPRTYAFDPVFAGLSEEQAANILGIEAPLWTETVYSRQRMDWQMFPRLLAVSETAWTARQNKNFAEFLMRLEVMEKRLEALGVHYAPRACYMQYPKISKFSPALRVTTREHPAMREYQQFHPDETRRPDVSD